MTNVNKKTRKSFWQNNDDFWKIQSNHLNVNKSYCWRGSQTIFLVKFLVKLSPFSQKLSQAVCHFAHLHSLEAILRLQSKLTLQLGPVGRFKLGKDSLGERREPTNDNDEIQSTERKKMVTGTFTYYIALHNKTLKERIKTQEKL